MSAEMLSAVRLADCRSARRASNREESDGLSFAHALGEAVASSEDAGAGSAAAAAADGETGRSAGAGRAVRTARSPRKDTDASAGDTADGDETKKTDVVSAGALLLLAAMLPGAAVTPTQTAVAVPGRADGGAAAEKAAVTVSAAPPAAGLSAAVPSPAGEPLPDSSGQTAPAEEEPAAGFPAASAAQPAEMMAAGSGSRPVGPDAGGESAGEPAGKSAVADPVAGDPSVGDPAGSAESRPAFSAVSAAAVRVSKPAAEQSPAAVRPSARPAASGSGEKAASAVPADGRRPDTRDDRADAPAASGPVLRADAAVGAAPFPAGGVEIAAGVPDAGMEKSRLTGRVARQIAAALQDSGAPARTQLRVHLSPAELGGINLRFATKNGRVTLQITADSSRTGTLLAAHLDDLSRSLAHSGVTMDRTEVFCQTGTDGQPGSGGWQGGSPPGSPRGFSSQAGPGQGDGRHRGGTAAPAARPAPAAPPEQEPSPARVSPGGMSIFA